jgi:hypothetical protein
VVESPAHASLGHRRMVVLIEDWETIYES